MIQCVCSGLSMAFLLVSALPVSSSSIHDDAMSALAGTCIRNRTSGDNDYQYEWCHEKHVHQYHTSVPIVLGQFVGETELLDLAGP